MITNCSIVIFSVTVLENKYSKVSPVTIKSNDNKMKIQIIWSIDVELETIVGIPISIPVQSLTLIPAKLNENTIRIINNIEDYLKSNNVESNLYMKYILQKSVEVYNISTPSTKRFTTKYDIIKIYHQE